MTNPVSVADMKNMTTSATAAAISLDKNFADSAGKVTLAASGALAMGVGVAVLQYLPLLLLQLVQLPWLLVISKRLLNTSLHLMVKKMVLILTMHDLSPLTGGFFFCVVNTGDVYMTKQQLADFEAKAKKAAKVVPTTRAYAIQYGKNLPA